VTPIYTHTFVKIPHGLHSVEVMLSAGQNMKTVQLRRSGVRTCAILWAQIQTILKIPKMRQTIYQPSVQQKVVDFLLCR